MALRQHRSTLLPYTTLFRSFGSYRVRGVNFASKEPISEDLQREGRKGETACVTELMASTLVRAFEDRAIEIPVDGAVLERDRKSTRLNSSHLGISYAVFCLK